MKVRAEIELSKRDTILAQLRRRKTYTIRRGGVHIRMWPRLGHEGLRIYYQLFPRRGVSVNGSAPTVTAAIEACNQVLEANTRHQVMPAPQQATKPTAARPMAEFRMPPAPADRFLPYKDE